MSLFNRRRPKETIKVAVEQARREHALATWAIFFAACVRVESDEPQAIKRFSLDSPYFEGKFDTDWLRRITKPNPGEVVLNAWIENDTAQNTPIAIARPNVNSGVNRLEDFYFATRAVHLPRESQE